MAIKGGALDTLTSSDDGSEVTSYIEISLMTEEYLSTGDYDRYACFYYFDITGTSAVDGMGADWTNTITIDGATYSSEYGENCGLLDPTAWGSDPASIVGSMMDYSVTLSELSSSLESTLSPYYKDWDTEYADYALGAAGAFYPSEQTHYGFGYEADAKGIVSVDADGYLENMIPSSVVATGADGFYSVRGMYVFGL